jgi:glycosyltransferase involved in cell wall biosynthesis
MNPAAIPDCPAVRLAYLVSHPIQYQAPLLRRIAREPDIDLTVLFGSDFSVRGYRDQGFGVDVAWDTPLLEGYRHEFLPPLRLLDKSFDTGTVSATSPISRGIYNRLRQGRDGTAASPAFDALWVHGYASVNALHGILAANALGIPVLLRAESWLGDRERAAWKLAAKSLFLRVLSNGIAAALPIGSANARYWSHYFGDRVPQFPMPYAVDNAYFSRLAAAAAPRQPALREELRLAPGRPVILFASKLQPRKHADHLIDAYRQLIANPGAPHLDSEMWASTDADAPASFPHPYLVIVGDGEERTRLEARCRELGLDDSGLDAVRFVGFRNQSELPRFFELADVFVLPSRHEPWGLIVNEAMAAGCAVVVSSDVGCHADLVTDGVEGCIFPVGDVPALAAALRRVFRTPATALAMGHAARHRIASWSFEEDVRGLRHALAHATRKLRP